MIQHLAWASLDQNCLCCCYVESWRLQHRLFGIAKFDSQERRTTRFHVQYSASINNVQNDITQGGKLISPIRMHLSLKFYSRLHSHSLA
jgi:hypothetical protein